jgi:hypothetical protein
MLSQSFTAMRIGKHRTHLLKFSIVQCGNASACGVFYRHSGVRHKIDRAPHSVELRFQALRLDSRSCEFRDVAAVLPGCGQTNLGYEL